MPPLPRESQRAAPAPHALEENVEAIKAWDRHLLHERTRAEQLGDWIIGVAASGPVLLSHLVWFAIWIGINTGIVPGITPFDRYPFTFLTMTVSLEAIFLSLFVMASQNRLSRQSDKRAHLDLQIDLLAEREMTAVLQLLQDIAKHLKVQGTLTPAQIRDLVTKTDVQDLTRRVDELGEHQSPQGSSN
jgi:uncharacterized membrane protein